MLGRSTLAHRTLGWDEGVPRTATVEEARTRKAVEACNVEFQVDWKDPVVDVVCKLINQNSLSKEDCQGVAFETEAGEGDSHVLILLGRCKSQTTRTGVVDQRPIHHMTRRAIG